ncbi:MAG: helix-turn-helix transcriptional regulator [Burkholderiales bacterium]|nr:helix-turn-helix transcriptional regulator [Burkholderiales bacterium]
MNDSIDGLLIELYRGSREVGWRQFQDWALDLLQTRLRFDSAWWGKGSYHAGYVHHLHLYRCRPEIVEDYRRWVDHDFMRAAVMSRPGVSVNLSDVMSREEFIRTPVYRHFCQPHSIEWSLATVSMVDEKAGLLQWISLRRSDPGQPFTEAERQLKQRLVPHLIEAERGCRQYFLRESGARLRGRPWGLCDAHGQLHEIGPQFVDTLRREWPDWSGPELPAPLFDALRAGRPYDGENIVIDTESVNGLYCLFARSRTAIDSLSPRERQVAGRYARGEDHARIASSLGVSPVTVRNQIQSVYRKLGINNKAELATRLSV